jgi:hypothetical protein
MKFKFFRTLVPAQVRMFIVTSQHPGFESRNARILMYFYMLHVYLRLFLPEE